LTVTTLRDSVLQDLWIHIAALVAVAIGAFAWYSRTHFSADPSAVELTFIIAGLAGLGLKIVNGSAAVLRAAIIAQQVAASQGIQPPAAVVIQTPPAPPR
jgi:hypothetical protein